MLKTIASNGYYDIAVDAAKNRIHLSIKGFWQTKDLVPYYINDINEAVSLLKPGFSILVNLTRMVSPTLEVSALHWEAQKLLIRSGGARSAEIVKDFLSMNMVEGYSAELGMPRRAFYDPGLAELWLDSLDE